MGADSSSPQVRIRRANTRAQMARLYAAVIAVVIAAGAILVYLDRRDAVADAQRKLRFLALEMADQQSHVVAVTRLLTEALAARPLLQGGDTEACNRALDAVRQDTADHLAGLAVVDPEGRLLCSTPPAPAELRLPLPPEAAIARASQRHAVGAMQRSPWLDRPYIPVFRGVGAAASPQRPVILAALSQDWLVKATQALPVPGVITVGLMTREGQVALRQPDEERWTGRDASQTALFAAMQGQAFSGLYYGEGLDRTAKVSAFAPYGKDTGDRLILWLAAPAGAVTAAASEATLAVGISAVAVVLALLVLLWRTTDRLVLQPAGIIAATARRLGSGDLLARVNLPHGDGEMARLAADFDHMAESLTRMDRVTRANRALEVLVAVRGAGDKHDSAAALCTGLCRQIVESGGYLHAWIAAVEGAEQGLEAAHVELLGAWLDPATPGGPAQAPRLPSADKPGPAGQAILDRRVVLTSSADEPAGVSEAGSPAHSTIAVPLLEDGGVRGVLTICASGEAAFGETEQALLGQLGQDVAARLAVLRERQARRKAQEALEATARLLARAEELSDAGSWSVDMRTGQLEGSDGFYRLLETDRASFGSSATAYRDRIHPEDAERAHKVFTDGVAQNLSRISDSYRIVTCLGEVRHVDVQYTLEEPVADGPKRATGTIRDVTRLSAAQSEVRKLSLVIEQMPSAVVITNLAAEVEYVNDAFVQTTGYQPREIIGQNPKLLKSGQTPAEVYQDMWAHLLRGEAWKGDFVNRKKDGTLFAEHAVIMPLHQADGRVSHYVAIKEDITVRKAQEAQLRKLVLAVEQSPASIAITDATGAIEYTNPAFTKQTGYSAAELLGSNPRLLQSGKTPAATYVDMWARLTRGETWQGELVNKRKDGSEYTELATLAPIRQADGKITHYLAVKDDITDRKQMAKELEQYQHHLEELVSLRTAELQEAQRRAEAANLAKSSFLANMSHEIRTPMNAIIGLTHLLRHTQPTPAQDERLQKIEKSARHLLSIINDILDLSKIEAGKLLVEEAVFSLDTALDDVLESLGERARDKGLSLTLERGANVPHSVSSDALRISQILLNLGTNAVKFTPQGGVVLRVQARPLASGRTLLRFEVQDTGIGLGEAEITKIFKAFEQADVSTTRKYGGTGLGLAISRRLVQLLGGEIGVVSAPGEGSTFWFTVEVGNADTAAPEPTRSNSAAPHRPRHRRPQDVRILVVEDDAFNQEVVVDLLQSEGFSVHVANNGAEALQRTAEGRYDLVLMDLQMPVLDGLNATRQMRQRPATRATPILAMSASAFSEDRADCLAAGMNDFVAKPVQPDELFAAVRDWTGVSLEVQPAARPALPEPAADAAPEVRQVAQRPEQPQLPPGLERVAQLDTHQGLRSVRGDREVYLRLLRRFCQEQGQTVAALDAALAEQRWADLRRAAHTLRSTAGMLGAKAIQQAATALEAGLRAEASAEVALEPLVAALTQPLAQLAGEVLAALPEEVVAEEQSLDHNALREVLRTLQALTEDDDTRAQAQFRKHAGMLRQGLGTATAGALERALEQYDFARAGEILAEQLSLCAGCP